MRVWRKRMRDASVLCERIKGSGSARCIFWISCTICIVMGTGGAILEIDRARPRCPARARVAALRILVCVCSVLVSVVAFCLLGCESLAARMMVHRVGQSSDQNSTSRDTRKCVQLLPDACTASLPDTGQLLRMRTFQAGSEPVVRMARTEIGFGCIASCVPSPLCCLCSAALVSTQFFVVRMVRSDMSAATLRKDVPGMACAVWTACSGMGVRNVQDPVLQQGHVPWMRKAKGRETGRAHQPAVTDRGLATTEWAGQTVNKPKGAAQALALARQQLAQARASAMPEACLRSLENEVQQETAMKQAQPLGQKMDRARPDFVALSNLERR